MKIINLTTVVILIFSSIYSQENKDDWPNLNRYQSDNESIKKIKNKTPRVVFIGNSITEGWDWHYPQFFKNNKNYINRGISGQTTQQCHSLWAFKQCLYIGFFDIDEYVNMQQHKSILDFLRSEPSEDIGSIALCDRDFYNPDNKLTNSFNFLKIYDCDKIILNGRHKHFVIPKNVQALSVHEITLGKPMHIVNENKAYFNHYFFLNKSNRGKNKTSMEDNSIDVHTQNLF